MLRGDDNRGGTDMRAFTISLGVGLLSIAIAAQAPPPHAAAVSKPATRPAGSLAQVMRGIFFPNSNIIFDVQQNDPAAPPKKSEGASATDAYSSAYSGWEIVENAAIAVTDGSI